MRGESRTGLPGAGQNNYAPTPNRAAKSLRLAAMSLGRSDHALGAFYRRLAARAGKAKAITATARKLAILV